MKSTVPGAEGGVNIAMKFLEGCRLRNNPPWADELAQWVKGADDLSHETHLHRGVLKPPHTLCCTQDHAHRYTRPHIYTHHAHCAHIHIITINK